MELWTASDFKDADDPLRKKRKRVSLACGSCRIRKVKCDQKRPCTSCVKKGVTCVYSEFMSESGSSEANATVQFAKNLSAENAALKKEIERLRKLIPQGNGTSSKDVSNDSWKSFAESSSVKSILKKDLPLKLGEVVHLKPDRLIYYGATSFRTFYSDGIDKDELLSDGKRYLSNARRLWKVQNGTKNIPHETYKDCHVASPELLLQNIKEYLPDYKTIQSYISLYLSSYWQYSMPIIDPTDFISDFVKIFVKHDSADYKFMITKKSIDYAKIALVLIVIKYSIVTLNEASTNSKFDRKNFLLEYIDTLLHLSKVQMKATLPALQTLLLCRQLKKLDPYDGDGGDNSNGSMLLKQAVNMAVIMGLHRDIDRVYKKETVGKRRLMKCIWKVLIAEDTIHSYQIGVPLTIRDEDIEIFPFDEKKSKDAIIIYIREASLLLNSSKGGACKLSEAIKIIKKIEQYDHGTFTKLSDHIKSFSTMENISVAYASSLSLHYKLLAIDALQILNHILLTSLPNDDEDMVYPFYNSSFKYGTLSVFYIIELLLIVNSHLDLNASDPKKLYPLVEIALSTIGQTKIPILQTCLVNYMRTEVQILKKTGFVLDQSRPPLTSYLLRVGDIEKFDPEDKTNSLHELFRTPSFLNGVISLTCRYMLKIQRDSYAGVFNMNFFLLTIVALFKYFDKSIEARLPPEQRSSFNALDIVINYDEALQDPTPSALLNTEQPSPDTMSNASTLSAHTGFPDIDAPNDWYNDYHSLFIPSLQSIMLNTKSSAETYLPPALDSVNLKGLSLDQLFHDMFSAEGELECLSTFSLSLLGDGIHVPETDVDDTLE